MLLVVLTGLALLLALAAVPIFHHFIERPSQQVGRQLADRLDRLLDCGGRRPLR